jgi:predicted amidohydrolase
MTWSLESQSHPSAGHPSISGIGRDLNTRRSLHQAPRLILEVRSGASAEEANACNPRAASLRACDRTAPGRRPARLGVAGPTFDSPARRGDDGGSILGGQWTGSAIIMRPCRALVYCGCGLLLGMGVGLSQVRAQDPAPDPPLPAAAGTGETVKVAGVVLKWIRGDKEANYRRAEPLIREAAALGAKIVCTTECFLDGYAIADKSIPLDVYRALGERIPDGPYCRRLMGLADELDIFLVAGMLEAEGTHRHNTAVLIGPDGSLRGKYHKQELGHELVRNTPGSVSSVFDTPLGRVGILICADRTRKAIVEGFRINGAEFLICPSGGMFGPERNDPIVQARSRENRTAIVFVHPAEFLVTAPDGSIARRLLLGDRLLIRPEEEGTAVDRSAVETFDLPVLARPDRPRP